MPSVTPSVKIDMRGLNRGLELAQQFSRRTPAEACNTAGYEIAVTTKNAMPAVKVGTVDSELALTVVPKIGKRGRPSKAKNPKKMYSGGRGTATQFADGSFGPRDVPLAALIIASRAKPGSRYNTLTNARYALGKNPFKGVSRAAGRAAMRALVDKMAKARRSSVNFLMAGWIPAVKTLKGFTANRFRKSSDANPGIMVTVHPLGYASPAKAGSTVAQCVIANDIGYEGKNRASFEQALSKCAPILQDKIDREGRVAMDYYLSKQAQELEKDFNAAAK